MNGQNIFDGCPTGDAWTASADPVKHEWARTAISRSLDDLDSTNTEPDDWESTMLANAIVSLEPKPCRTVKHNCAATKA